MKNPDFICIGAQKAGTTWLHRNLDTHPDVSFPYFKELHYYDEIEEGICTNLYCRFFDGHWKNEWWRHTLKYSLYEAYKAKDLHKLMWLSKYFFAPRGKRWYRSLFPNEAGTITGDMTPEYGILRQELIRQIHSNYPQTKIILLLRNPIERDWSNIKMWQKRVKGMKSIQDVDMQFLIGQAKHNNDLSNYKMMIENWGSIFPKENFLIRFFDEIKEDPINLLKDTYKFLGINSDHSAGTEKSVVNKGLTDKIPDEVASVLKEKHFDNLRAIEPLFEAQPTNYVTKWMKESY